MSLSGHSASQQTVFRMSSLSTERQTPAGHAAPVTDRSVISDEPAPAEAGNSPEPGNPGPPAWFRQRRPVTTSGSTGASAGPDTSVGPATVATSVRESAGALTTDSTADARVDDRHWTKRVMDGLSSAAAESYGVSLIVHLILLFCMSLYIFQLRADNNSVSLVASDANSLPTEFEEIVALELDSAGNAEQTALPQNQTLPFQTDPTLTSDAAVDFAKFAGNGEGQQGDDASSMLFQMPSGGQVVSAGSFTAWTVPRDPRPGEDYKIIIMIRVPKRQPLYRVSDLSGVVIGTDGFRLEIPFGKFRDRFGTRIPRGSQLRFPRRTDRIRVVDGSVQIVVDIPGASRLVKDTIEVKSRMLKEEQTLEIEF